MTPFDFLNSVTQNKKDLMTEETEHLYVPFVINRSLSYFPDTILYANELNQNKHIDKKLQYQYLLNTVRPSKRYAKWVKYEQEDEIGMLMQIYKCGAYKAHQYSKVLTPQQKEQLKYKWELGKENVHI